MGENIFKKEKNGEGEGNMEESALFSRDDGSGYGADTGGGCKFHLRLKVNDLFYI